jgi:ATP-binding cassette, subfamily B, bacterial
MTTGALQVLHGNMTLGTMLALNAVSIGFLGPIGNLLSTALSLEMVGTYLSRVNDVLEALPEEDAARVRVAPRLEGKVEVENVSFRYGQHGRPVLDGVSLRIEPGQFVAIVGASGSGKTTLANLIVGLYRPASGRVLFDGNDLTELNLRSVRRQVGIVNQRLNLFGATIRENISLSDPSMSLEEVVQAAKLAHIHEDIEKMPLKYNTTLMEGGSSVSGGQKQRLALARALASRPAILLLDEATSALDAVTEGKVQASLAAQRCTRIVIAHRLSTVRSADVIVVMDSGRIVESGSHEDLLSRQGAYARLVAAQMGRRGMGNPPRERTAPIVSLRQRSAGAVRAIGQHREPDAFEAIGAGDRLATLVDEADDTVITERPRHGEWGQ